MTTTARLCPICRKPRDHASRPRGDSAIENPHAPFCSARCKDRDLVRWFSDGYAVPGRPADPDEIVRSEELGQDSD